MQYSVRTMRLGEPDVHEDLVEADSAAAAQALVAEDGRVVLSVRRRLAWRPPQGRERNRFPLFCREVRTLIRAGMTVVEAVDTLSARERLEGGQRRSVAAEVLSRLQQGQSLSNALSDLPDVPQVLVAAVRAGERTSNLAEALDDYLRFDTLVQQLRGKVISASIYPALVTALGIAISLFLLLVVMPSFGRMYQNLRGSASGSTAFMIEISQFLTAHRGLAFAALALVAVAGAWWTVSGGLKRTLQRVAERTPWIRVRLHDFQLAMTYQALALLLKGGYPMVEALAVASRSALSAPLAAALGRARGRIESGGAVSAALAAEGLCDEVGRRLMAAAERNGGFSAAADVVSRLHGERFELFVERVTRLVEPVLLLGVALMVGGIVVMMYLPVFDMSTRLR